MSKRPVFKPQEGPQTDFATCMADICLYGGAAGGGKALHPDTPVMTPYGMTPIKDIKVGARVMNPDGAHCNVIGVYPQPNVAMYEVIFSDGTRIEACKDHQWVAWTRNRKIGRAKELEKTGIHPDDDFDLYPSSAKVITTFELQKWVDNDYSPQVPVTRPLILTTTYRREELIINPYAIGAIFLRPNLERVRMWKFTKQIPEPYRVEGAEANEFCRKFDLMGVPIPDRRIPEHIMQGSLEDRLLFAQGIMDRHGKAGKHEARADLRIGEYGPLVEDLLYLFRSLGCIAKIANTDKTVQITIKVSPFIDLFPFNKDNAGRFKPAKARLGKTIKSIKFIGTGPAICIAVDHPNKLYLTENFTVTHNTFGLLLEPLKWLDVPNFHSVIFRRVSTEITQPGGLWDESLNIYPNFGGVPTTHKKLWTFPNGNKVQMMGLEYDSTLEEKKGLQSPLIMFDELSTFTERMFFYLMSRNRAPGISGYLRATTNPSPDSWLRQFIDWWLDDKGFPIQSRSGVVRYFIRIGSDIHWADSKQELIDLYGPKYGYENILPRSFTFIPAKLDDNKYLGADYRSGLSAQSRADREMLLDGCWDVKIDAGTFFKREWVTQYRTIDEPVSWVRYWDRAATTPNEKNPDPDYSVGVLLGRGKKSKNIYIEDVERFRLGPFEGRVRIGEIADKDKEIYGNVKVVIERDPGAAGVIEARTLAQELGRHSVAIRPVTKDKLTRFKPFSSAAERGDIHVKHAGWNKAFFSELEDFIGDGKGHDDQVDATAGAYTEFAISAYRLDSIAIPSFKQRSILGGL